jgi:hypothetical protein
MPPGQNQTMGRLIRLRHGTRNPPTISGGLASTNRSPIWAPVTPRIDTTRSTSAHLKSIAGTTSLRTLQRGLKRAPEAVIDIEIHGMDAFIHPARIPPNKSKRALWG